MAVAGFQMFFLGAVITTAPPISIHIQNTSLFVHLFYHYGKNNDIESLR
jgi:hypothetical protein